MSGIRHNIVLTLSRQLLSALVQFASALLIARVLGPAGNGVYVLAVFLPATLVALSNFGMNAATVYYVSGNRQGLRQLLWLVARIGMLLSLLGLVAGAVVVNWFAEAWFPGVPSLCLWLALAAFPFSLLASLAQSVLQGVEDFRRYNAAILLTQVVSLALVALATLVIGATVEVVLGCALASALVSMLLVLVYLRQVLHAHPPAGEPGASDRELLASMLHYGRHSYVANLIGYFLYRANLLIINLLAGPAQVGVYVIALRLGEYVWVLSSAVSTATFPRLSARDTDAKTRRETIATLFRITLLLSAGLATGLALLSGVIVGVLFGEAYAGAVAPLLLLLPGIVLFGASRILANATAAGGRPDINVRLGAVIALVSVALCFALVPVYGIAGAALATSLAYALDLLLRAVVVTRMESLPVRELVPGRSDVLRLWSFARSRM